MRTLGEATDFLLRCEDPTEWVMLADKYILAYRKAPEQVIIPKEHAAVAPLVKAFAHNEEGWFRFLRALKEDFLDCEGLRGRRYRPMQQFFRVVEQRFMQKFLREKRRACLAWFDLQYPDVPTLQKKLWMTRLEQLWMKQRRAWLAAHRKQRGGKLNLDEQRQVLDEFWADVDDNIKQGNLPKYE